MKSTFHKCVVHVVAGTNPTQYTKLANSNVRFTILCLLGVTISRMSMFFTNNIVDPEEKGSANPGPGMQDLRDG